MRLQCPTLLSNERHKSYYSITQQVSNGTFRSNKIRQNWVAIVAVKFPSAYICNQHNSEFTKPRFYYTFSDKHIQQSATNRGEFSLLFIDDVTYT